MATSIFTTLRNALSNLGKLGGDCNAIAKAVYDDMNRIIHHEQVLGFTPAQVEEVRKAYRDLCTLPPTRQRSEAGKALAAAGKYMVAHTVSFEDWYVARARHHDPEDTTWTGIISHADAIAYAQQLGFGDEIDYCHWSGSDCD